MKRLISLTIAVFIVTMLTAQYKVIVNSGNSATSLSKKEVSDYFLKKASKWSDGKEVTPVDQKESSKTRASFSQEIHNKNVAEVESYWQQLVFSGKGTPIIEKNSDSEIIDFVKSNPGAIGYISASTSADGVKVISVK